MSAFTTVLQDTEKKKKKELLHSVRLPERCITYSQQDVRAPVQRRHVFQVSDPHEGFVKVVQLQNTGQQEKARDENTGEEF